MDLLRHLNFFVTVAEERHFGRAATRLGMAQPPLSQGVRRLEASLEVVLFDRGRGGVALTSAGRDLLPRARALLEDATGIRRAAQRHARAGRTRRLGVVPELGARLVAALATELGAVTEDRVAVSTGTTVRLLDDLAAGALDLAAIVHPAPLEGLAGGPVVALPTDVLLPATHRAARHGASVPLRQLSDLEFVTGPRSAGPAAHDLLLDTLDTRGCTSAPADAENLTAALAQVATGRAFALTADPDLAARGVARHPVAGEPVPLRVQVAHRGLADTDPALLAATEVLRAAAGTPLRAAAGARS